VDARPGLALAIVTGDAATLATIARLVVIHEVMQELHPADRGGDPQARARARMDRLHPDLARRRDR
jgi:hypothetical protein